MASVGGKLTGHSIHDALRALGKELGSGPEIQILIIGGAAGLLAGLLPVGTTTGDVDAVDFRPPSVVEEVLEAAIKVADREGLPRGWLSVDAGLFATAIPDGWEARCLVVGQLGRLVVRALGRRDLIAMKFFAHRAGDLEHLVAMNVTADEIAFTKRHLTQLGKRLPGDRAQIEMALRVAGDWSAGS